jgi:hypothetical protein
MHLAQGIPLESTHKGILAAKSSLHLKMHVTPSVEEQLYSLAELYYHHGESEHFRLPPL